MNKDVSEIYDQIVEIARAEVRRMMSTDQWGTATSASSDGMVEVKLDGGDASAPCVTVARVHKNDRVLVNVDPVSRTPIVKGNYSKPAATDEDLSDAEQYASDIADFVGYSAVAAKTMSQRVSDLETAQQQYTGDLPDQVSDTKAFAEERSDTFNGAVGVLAWACEHGTFSATSDTKALPGKYYFSLSGTTYSVVASPTGNPSSHGWYELSGFDQTLVAYCQSLEVRIEALET